VTQKKRTVLIEQSLETKCERIPVATYAEHRKRTEKMIRLYKEELTVQLAVTATAL